MAVWLALAVIGTLGGWIIGRMRVSRLERDLAVTQSMHADLELSLANERERVADSVREATSLREQVLARAQRVAELETRLAGLDELSAQLRLREEALKQVQEERARLMERQGTLNGEASARDTQLTRLHSELQQTTQRANQLEQVLSSLKAQHAELQAMRDADQRQFEEKLALLRDAREQMGAQFHQLATQILDEKSKKFTEQNQQQLGGLLAPLQERIKEFQQKVEETYDKESKERFSLANEVKKLADLNLQMREDAVNLTQALKGNNKAQGTWGEIVLERVLESSGLRKGQEYEVQASMEREDGGQHRPDVIINLPEGKHLIVDSKMTLVAYERYASAEDDAQRADALKLHLAAVRNHVKQLGDKHYHTLHGAGGLDFVLMFLPVEPAFMLSVTEDPSLFADAFSRNVLLVSPSTLLATLRTIANIWRQEYQNRNAQEIAAQCGKLYDKFVGFVTDLETVGQRLDQTRTAYEAARNKLASGRGNLIRQAEQVRKLGVRPSKQLPASVLDLTEDEAEQDESVDA
ncbi:DNA recombination protein RmuC [Burkholderiaceae bacterium DAT-1]|nr:DNA recombination protein RmuC [Burkholderiaceae bacterium DAT-1]